MSRRKDLSMMEQFGETRADYDMMKESRFIRRRQGLAPMGGSGDYHIRHPHKFYEAIEKARDMDRNDMLVGQGLQRKAVNEVQGGFTIDPDTGDKAIDDELWNRFEEFRNDADLCDVSGELTFPEMEVAIARGSDRDGDLLVSGTEDGPLQLFEGHTIQNTRKHANTFLGVTLAANRRRKKFWVTGDNLDATQSTKEQAVALDVRDGKSVRQLFHVYDATRRVTLTRGLSILAPVFSVAGMVDDINFARMVQQQIASCWAVIREQASLSQNSGNPLPATTASYGDRSTEVSPSGQLRALEGMQPGMQVVGRPGETIKMDSPKVPNAEFFSHVRLLVQILGVNIGLPLVMLMMDASETNFSGFRGAVDEARRLFRFSQNGRIRRFYSPFWRWKVSQWIDDDPAMKAAAKKKKIDLFCHKWNPPSWPYIEPVGDATGDLLRVSNHLTSRRRVSAERSTDFETTSTEGSLDNAFIIRQAKLRAAELNAEFPKDEPVTWRDVMSLPMPQGIQVSIPVGEKSDQQSKSNKQPAEQTA